MICHITEIPYVLSCFPEARLTVFRRQLLNSRHEMQQVPETINSINDGPGVQERFGEEVAPVNILSLVLQGDGCEGPAQAAVREVDYLNRVTNSVKKYHLGFVEIRRKPP